MLITRQMLLFDAIEKLRQNPGSVAELDARILVCAVCNLTLEDLVGEPNETVSQNEQTRLRNSIGRRLAGEPVSRIIGHRSFWKHEFVVSPDTLDPRPDTESLVELVLKIVEKEDWISENISILDLGTGSGCILISLLHELKNARGTGVDLSKKALDVAQSNAEITGVAERAQFICSDWFDNVSGIYHLIVSNPPYIREEDIAGLETEVSRFDPFIALNGGADGLLAYRLLIPDMVAFLRPGGWGVFEVGDGQGGDVLELLDNCGYAIDDPQFCQAYDLSKKLRVVAGKLQNDVVR